MAKIIGVYCNNCNATAVDFSDKCLRCGTPYNPEIVLMGKEHRDSMRELVKAEVDPDIAVRELALASSKATPTMRGSGMLKRIRYFISEFNIG